MTRGDPGALPWVPRTGGLPALREALPRCRGCDLWEGATQPVPGAGPADAAMMVVGEQPGDHEDRSGEPFVGPAGRLLDRALHEAGIDREVVYRTNAVKHFRFDSRGRRRIHQSPARWQVAACGPWLLAEVERVTPRVVVLLGATAGQAVHGPSLRVGRVRGTVMGWPGDRLHLAEAPDAVVTTVHPSSVLRSRNRDEDFAAFVADLSVAAAQL